MAKRKLVLLGAGVCVCVTIYGILTKSLMVRAVFEPYKASVPWSVLTTDSLSPLVKGERDQVVTTEDGTHATKAMGDEKPLPMSQNITKPSRLRQDMSCKLKKNVPFSTITRTQAPKDKNRGVLPEESLEKLVHFNSCAVVSSSHALRVHTYGQEIDSHDAVLRFNCAPTDKFEKFVGNRTDIRMVNTLIPSRRCRPEFWSENSTSMFRHGRLVIRNMNAINLTPRGLDLKRDTHHAFENWFKYRKTFPNRTLPFIQRPKFGQDLQAEVMRFCDTTRLCNKTKWSPSTGIFGVVMMMHLCDWVRVYEFVPSNRDNTTHVYYFDENFVRPRDDLHSYNQERTYVKTLSLTPDTDIEDTGVVLLEGLSRISCG